MNQRHHLGEFIGRVRTEWVNDGDDNYERLLEPFAYVDPQGVRWDAPLGLETDGASIPRFFWRFIGAPLSGRYRRAAVVHDAYCESRERPYRDVHRMFYYACRCAGVGKIKAWLMWVAVRFGGPRW